MSIQVDQLRQYIIVPVLQKLGLDSLAAQNLLLGTCAQESQMGTYLHQVNGPALGIYQMEPETHDDCYVNFLKYQPELNAKLGQFCQYRSAQEMVYNLYYATAMARIRYLRAPGKLPDADDIEGLAAYYKQYYNTPLGSASEAQFVTNYKKYIGA